MVLHHIDQSIITHPFDQVCQAYTLRYPNPFSPHVISSDVLKREWDSENRILYTTRLLLKRGTLPTWAPRGIIEKSETWVLEESQLDVIEGKLDVSSRNLDHRKVIEVIETLKVRARGEVSHATTSAQVTSSWGFHLLRNRIERYGVSRFQRQTKNARLGLEMTIQILQPNSTLRDRLLNGEKLNYPPITPSSAVAARLHALRQRAKENKERISALIRTGAGLPMQSHEVMSKEEEAELKELEHAYGLASEMVDETLTYTSTSNLDSGKMSYSTNQPKRRWFWWCRWRLGGSDEK
ncbi:PRELI-like family-domain-containing protein [Melampsora americana]|nr:PRELI-like family-domain-containing protein [Melampsora americana]